jgi:hypothetical protein
MSDENPKRLFEDIDKIDDSPDWDEVISVSRNRSRYQADIIEELLGKADAISEDLRGMSMRETLTIGPLLPDNPDATTYAVINHIKESFLKVLEQKGLIKGLGTNITDDASGASYVVAQFGFVPSSFKSGIKSWKAASTSEKKNAAEAPEKRGGSPTTQVIGDGGYLLIGKDKIFIGKATSGKFRLIETLCTPELGVRRTADAIFEYTKTNKNKSDASYKDAYLSPQKKETAIGFQFKEIKRAIRDYAKENGMKKLSVPQLTLKWDENRNAWLEVKRGT